MTVACRDILKTEEAINFREARMSIEASALPMMGRAEPTLWSGVISKKTSATSNDE